MDGHSITISATIVVETCCCLPDRWVRARKIAIENMQLMDVGFCNLDTGESRNHKLMKNVK